MFTSFYISSRYRKASRRNQQNAFAASLTGKDHPQATSCKPIYLGKPVMCNVCSHSAKPAWWLQTKWHSNVSLRASSPIWASKASLARTREPGGGGSTMMKGNLCIYKCFIDVLYIFDRFFKKKLGNAPDLRQVILLLIFALCSADFTCGNGSWRCQCYVN